MSNILRARVTFTGTRPLLWHHFGEDAIPLEKKERTGVAGNDPEEWRKTVLVTEGGELYIEPSYVFATIRDGSRHTKKGRGSIQSAVAATLQVEDLTIKTGLKLPKELTRDASQPVYLDVRSVKNPTTKGRNLRYRVAAAPGWTFQATILWDATIVARGQMEASVKDAGALCGIGDGRAIGFGRFEATVEYLGAT